MSVIEKVRELGKEIQKDERYIAFSEARTNNDSDVELQELINEFGKKRAEMNELLAGGGETEKTQALNSEANEIYLKIMDNENMIRYQQAKQDMDDLLAGVMSIISASVRGQDPDTAQIEKRSCGGNCSGCSGCK